jgi:hypothetical protein
VFSKALKKNRETLAFGLLAVPVLVFIVGLSLLFKNIGGNAFGGGLGFSDKAAAFGDVFLGPVVALSVAAAALLVTTGGELTRNARTVVLGALGIGGACILLGVVCMFAALGAGDGVGRSIAGSGRVTGLLYSLALLVFAVLALLLVAAVFRGLPATRPIQPGWGAAQPWGQQPGQQAWGQQPDQQWTSDPHAWGAPSVGGWDPQTAQQPGWGQIQQQGQPGWGQPEQPPAPGWGPPDQYPPAPGWGQPQPQPVEGWEQQPAHGWAQPGQPPQPQWAAPMMPAVQPAPSWGQPVQPAEPGGPGWGQPADPADTSAPGDSGDPAEASAAVPADPAEGSAPDRPDPADPAEPSPPAADEQPPRTGGWWQQPGRG